MSANSPTRAPRMDLHLPLRFRQLGETSWTQSVTQNISSSGVLFQDISAVPTDSIIEIEVSFPFVTPLHVAGGRFRGRARIVRHAEFAGRDGLPRAASAAAFVHYDLIPAA